MFTSKGYSVRWRILNFADYGLCQRRRRFILFASCPGGLLPDIPEPTHGILGQRVATIHDAINNIYPSCPNHNPRYTLQLPPYNARTQLRHVIATGGTTSYHPNGLRHFTVRELACMQGFPVDFKFGLGLTEGEMRRQIRNAVPPVVARVLLAAVKAALVAENRTLAREYL